MINKHWLILLLWVVGAAYYGQMCLASHLALGNQPWLLLSSQSGGGDWRIKALPLVAQDKRATVDSS